MYIKGLRMLLRHISGCNLAWTGRQCQMQAHTGGQKGFGATCGAKWGRPVVGSGRGALQVVMVAAPSNF